MPATKPTLKILDLFCGAGGAAVGLHRAFPEAQITGVLLLCKRVTQRCIFDSQFFNLFTKRFDVHVIKRMGFFVKDFQIFNSIIAFVVIFMMNNFPRFKASFQMLCHNQPMLINISIFASHRKIGIRRIKPNFNISTGHNAPSSPPMPMIFAGFNPLGRIEFGSTTSATGTLRFAVFQHYPFLSCTITAGRPLIFSGRFFTYFRTFYSISKSWFHFIILTQKGIIINGYI